MPAAETAWVSAGTAHLDPGGYSAQFLLPPGATLSQVEVAPPCVNAIEPASGWQATGVTTSGRPRDHGAQGDRLGSTSCRRRRRRSSSTGDSVPGRGAVRGGRGARHGGGPRRDDARATRAGLRAIVSFEVPESGLYCMPAFLTPGDGQRFLVDGCRKAVVCPAETSGWRPVMSADASRPGGTRCC